MKRVSVVIFLLIFCSPAGSQFPAGPKYGVAYAQVKVNEFIDVVLINVPVRFPPIDPGTNNTPALAGNGWPMKVVITDFTNVPSNLTLNATDDFRSATNDTFGISNLSYSNNSSGDKTEMSLEYPEPPYPDWIRVPAPASEGANTTRDVFFWIDVPKYQNAGDYTTTTNIKVSRYV
jgi:hypothetical protein